MTSLVHHARVADLRVPLRLTRRGRAAIRLGGFVGAVIVALAGLLLTTRVAAAGEDSVGIPVTHYVVAEGETLWGIAGQVAPERDRRETVAEIVELNALPDATVHPGEQIAVPLYR